MTEEQSTLSPGATLLSAGAPAILVVPAHDRRKLAKAVGLPADELLMDLEDSVPDSEKSAARIGVQEFLGASAETMSTAVRINPVDSSHGQEDLRAIVAAPTPPRTIVLPKVEEPGEVELAARALESAGLPTRLQALIETAVGVASIDAIASASPRLEALVLGYEDLAASLGRDKVEDRAEIWLPIQHQVALAATVWKLNAIDGPTVELDAEKLAEACDRARGLGFSGKWAIHPSQLQEIHARLGVSAAEIAHARAVIEALADAEKSGRGAARLDGRMIDAATALRARAILDQHRA